MSTASKLRGALVRSTKPHRATPLLRLMEQYLDGSPTAYGRLYAALTPRVRRQICARIGEGPDVDDLVQQTFLRAHAARASYEVRAEAGDEGLVAWFCSIARNTAINHLRKRYRDRLSFGEGASRLIEEAPCTDPDAEQLATEAAGGAARNSALHIALERLPPGQREVVRLSKLEGLPLRAVAANMGLRDVAVRVRVHRAYRTLRECLTELLAHDGHQQAS